ncbi:hypothetical protein E4L67_35800, partial [Burkholderia pseudomallei]
MTKDVSEPTPPHAPDGGAPGGPREPAPKPRRSPGARALVALAWTALALVVLVAATAGALLAAAT